MTFDTRVKYRRTPGRIIGIWVAKVLLVVPIVLLVLVGIWFVGDGESWHWDENIWFFVGSATCWTLAYLVYWAWKQSEEDRKDLEDEAHHLRQLSSLYAANWWYARKSLDDPEHGHGVSPDWEIGLRESAGRNQLHIGGDFEPIVASDADWQSGRISGLRATQILALIGAVLIGLPGIVLAVAVAVGFARGTDPDIFVVGIPMAMIAGAAALFRSVAWAQGEIRVEKRRRASTAEPQPLD